MLYFKDTLYPELHLRFFPVLAVNYLLIHELVQVLKHFLKAIIDVLVAHHNSLVKTILDSRVVKIPV